jgi:hypothetical protein
MKHKKRYAASFYKPKFGLAAIVGRVQMWGIKRGASVGGIDTARWNFWRVKSLQD